MGTDDTTLIERVEPNSFVAADDRLPVDLSSSKKNARPGDTQTSTQNSGVLLQDPEQVERDTTSQKKEAEKLEFEAWLDFRNFRIWRMTFSSEVSSCASRPIEAVIWIKDGNRRDQLQPDTFAHEQNGG